MKHYIGENGNVVENQRSSETRIVQYWSSLPKSTVEAGSLDRFKSALKRFLF